MSTTTESVFGRFTNLATIAAVAAINSTLPVGPALPGVESRPAGLARQPGTTTQKAIGFPDSLNLGTLRTLSTQSASYLAMPWSNTTALHQLLAARPGADMAAVRAILALCLQEFTSPIGAPMVKLELAQYDSESSLLAWIDTHGMSPEEQIAREDRVYAHIGRDASMAAAKHYMVLAAF